MEWQGSLPLICHACYLLAHPDEDMPRNAFKVKVRQAWNARMQNAGQILKRVRSVAWETARKDIKERYPGESKKAWRARLIAESKTLACAFAAGLARLPPEARVRAGAALSAWIDEWQRKAADGAYVPTLEVTLTDDWLLQFVDEILPGVNEYFLCRHRECLTMTRNCDWLHNCPDGGHFLCSQCGEQYRPWTQKPGYVRCNKVWVVEAAGAGGPAPDGPCTWHVIPATWADTATQVMLNKMKEIMAPPVAAVAELPAADRLPYITALMREKAPQREAYFTRMEVTLEAMEKMAERNERHPTKPLFRADHLADGFVYGCRLGADIPLDEPMSQEDLLVALALGRWLSEQPRALS